MPVNDVDKARFVAAASLDDLETSPPSAVIDVRLGDGLALSTGLAVITTPADVPEGTYIAGLALHTVARGWEHGPHRHLKVQRAVAQPY